MSKSNVSGEPSSHLFTRDSIYIYSYKYIYLYMYISTYLYLYKHLRLFTYAYIYIYMSTYVMARLWRPGILVHIYIYIYISEAGAVSPTGKSYSFRSCVRASEAACSCGTLLFPWRVSKAPKVFGCVVSCVVPLPNSLVNNLKLVRACKKVQGNVSTLLHTVNSC